MHTFDPNDYQGSDSARINHAIADARKEGFPFVRVFPRKGDQTSSRNYWLLDEAILLPDNMTLYLCNCKLKLSDQCRDNFIRSANCVPGRTELEVIHNLHIIGEGKAVLEGADHPRSTGDGGKTLGIQKLEAYPADTPDLSRRMTYGTDAGKEGEIQKGDWRNIGILLSYVQDFSIENLTLQHTHCWAVSLEYCRKGKVRSLEFLNEEKMLIDGVRERFLNQDGLDLRRGCRDILIEDITGHTGDDLIALTAIGGTEPRESGMFGRTEYCGPSGVDPREDDVFNIMIRNIRGYSAGKFMVIRFLNQGGVKMHHILVDGVQETAPEGHHSFCVIAIGSPHYKGSAALGETYGFKISNVMARATYAIVYGAPLRDSVFSDICLFRALEKGSVFHHDVFSPGNTYELENISHNNIQCFDRLGE